MSFPSFYSLTISRDLLLFWGLGFFISVISSFTLVWIFSSQFEGGTSEKNWETSLYFVTDSGLVD